MLNNIVNKVKGKANSLDVEILTDKSKFPECEKIENENDYVGVKLKRDPEHEVEVWFYFISSCGPDIYDGEQLDAYAALCMENMVLRTYRSRIEQDGSCSQMLQ